MTGTTAERVIQIIADIMGVEPEKAAQLDAKLLDDLGADSLDTVEIEMEIEKEFGIAEKAVDPQEHWRVRDLIDAVEKQLP